MIANYHSHTIRCKHAKDTEREYVERAIEGGLKILGFSDHAPMPFAEDYISPVRMSMNEIDDYVRTVMDLKEEYKDEIEIHLGFEAEYFPNLHETFMRFIADYPIEYLLLGQHYMGEDTERGYVAKPMPDEDRMSLYVKRVEEAIATGCFTYVAHPDVYYFNGDPEIYDKLNRKICECAKAAGLPLEINFLGIEDHRHYPNRPFWKVAGEVGNDVIFGADAHSAANVWRPDAVKIAQKIVDDYGLRRIDTTRLSDPFCGRHLL